MAVLYKDNDMLIEIPESNVLKDKDGNPVTGATVEATLYNSDGTEVSGVTWPITLSGGDTDGEYWGILPDTAEVVVGNEYSLEVTATKSDADAKWVEPIKVKNRRFK